MPTTAWGFGLATIDAQGTVLDVWFPSPALGERPAGAVTPPELSSLQGSDVDRGVTRDVLLVEIDDLQAPPTTTEDVWLRLHLLSTRLVVPHSVSLDGIFGLLTNVVWTSAGPCAVEGFESTRARLRSNGRHVTVHGVDKFPRLVDYVLPTGVRIADGDRVRLGAHLAEGTTVMHEGFVNYNAGTLGASMVEGRISAGVVVGDGSDVGGGASIMGTLSGGGTQVISVGRRCLLGANSGLGISLGDDCVVEAGCYVTAGTKVTVHDDLDGVGPTVVKALALSGASNVLFRRNSVTGAIEAVPWKSGRIALNAALHAN
jgi:2,3,4,5-tetrahydropyridine-2-carboxylate N-succinyltransferase